MARDEALYARAEAIAAVVKTGRTSTNRAAKDAAEGMIKLIANSKSTEARALALEAHAYEIGIAREFVSTIVPLLNTMQQDIVNTGADEDTAEVLTDIFLAKIFKGIIERSNEEK